MKQINLFLLCIISGMYFEANALDAIKKGFKKAEKGTKDIAKKTEKGIVKAHQETAKGIATAAKQTDAQIKAGSQTIAPGLELAGKETLKGLETAGKETGQFFVDYGLSEIAPFITPGKELKAFKTQMFYGVGGGKTVKPKDTATWRIGTGCIVGAKAWVVEPLTIKARDYEKMTPEQKKNTDVDIAVENYMLEYGKGVAFGGKSPKQAWEDALKNNVTLNYHRFLGDWDVYEVTAKDNQCISHDFAVDYDPKSKKINIKKTK